MKSIYLCGFMGCGKSTVGRSLARKLGCAFFDMDEYIAKQEGMTIPEIFARKGEPYFRQAETEAVKKLAEKRGVIACGGGAMLKRENAEIASAAGTVVYIEIPFEDCYARISGDPNRPVVMNNTKEKLEEIYSSRVPAYERHSKFKVSGEGSPEEIAVRIANTVKY